MKSRILKPWKIYYGLKTQKLKLHTELRIATWNVTSFFRTGECKNLTDVLNTFWIS